jgi:hypothetical protein
METESYRKAEQRYFVALFRRIWYINARVCELGCGCGFVLKNQYVNKDKYLGVCESKEGLEYLQKKYPTIRFENTSPNHFFMRERLTGRFDIYISLTGCLTVNAQFLAKLRYVLEFDGCALINVKNKGRADAVEIVKQLKPLRVDIIPHKRSKLLKISPCIYRLTKLIYLYDKIHANLDNADQLILFIRK